MKVGKLLRIRNENTVFLQLRMDSRVKHSLFSSKMDGEEFELHNLLNEIDNENNLINIQIMEGMIYNNVPIRRKYHVRKRLNPMEDYDDDEFKRRYRFTKNQVQELYNLVDGQNTLEPTVSINSIQLSKLFSM